MALNLSTSEWLTLLTTLAIIVVITTCCCCCLLCLLIYLKIIVFAKKKPTVAQSNGKMIPNQKIEVVSTTRLKGTPKSTPTFQPTPTRTNSFPSLQNWNNGHSNTHTESTYPNINYNTIYANNNSNSVLVAPNNMNNIYVPQTNISNIGQERQPSPASPVSPLSPVTPTKSPVSPVSPLSESGSPFPYHDGQNHLNVSPAQLQDIKTAIGQHINNKISGVNKDMMARDGLNMYNQAQNNGNANVNVGPNYCDASLQQAAHLHLLLKFNNENYTNYPNYSNNSINNNNGINNNSINNSNNIYINSSRVNGSATTDMQPQYREYLPGPSQPSPSPQASQVQFVNSQQPHDETPSISSAGGTQQSTKEFKNNGNGSKKSIMTLPTIPDTDFDTDSQLDQSLRQETLSSLRKLESKDDESSHANTEVELHKMQSSGHGQDRIKNVMNHLNHKFKNKHKHNKKKSKHKNKNNNSKNTNKNKNGNSHKHTHKKQENVNKNNNGNNNSNNNNNNNSNNSNNNNNNNNNNMNNNKNGNNSKNNRKSSTNNHLPKPILFVKSFSDDEDEQNQDTSDIPEMVGFQMQQLQQISEGDYNYNLNSNYNDNSDANDGQDDDTTDQTNNNTHIKENVEAVFKSESKTQAENVEKRTNNSLSQPHAQEETDDLTDVKDVKDVKNVKNVKNGKEESTVSSALTEMQTDQSQRMMQLELEPNDTNQTLSIISKNDTLSVEQQRHGSTSVEVTKTQTQTQTQTLGQYSNYDLSMVEDASQNKYEFHMGRAKQLEFVHKAGVSYQIHLDFGEQYGNTMISIPPSTLTHNTSNRTWMSRNTQMTNENSRDVHAMMQGYNSRNINNNNNNNNSNINNNNNNNNNNDDNNNNNNDKNNETNNNNDGDSTIAMNNVDNVDNVADGNTLALSGNYFDSELYNADMNKIEDSFADMTTTTTTSMSERGNDNNNNNESRYGGMNNSSINTSGTACVDETSFMINYATVSDEIVINNINPLAIGGGINMTQVEHEQHEQYDGDGKEMIQKKVE